MGYQVAAPLGWLLVSSSPRVLLLELRRLQEKWVVGFEKDVTCISQVLNICHRGQLLQGSPCYPSTTPISISLSDPKQDMASEHLQDGIYASPFSISG